MRNWHPFLADTLAEMSAAGIRRAVGFTAAAHRSYSSCLQYRENVRDARAALREKGLPDVEIVYVDDWHTHPGFIEASAVETARALARLASPLREQATLVFTAHSIPSQHGRTLSVSAAVRRDGAADRRDGARAQRAGAAARDGVSEPERTAGGSLARPGHRRLDP